VAPLADGFLGRWSQRKQAQREGRVLDEPAAPERVASAEAAAPAGLAMPKPQALKPCVNPAGKKTSTTQALAPSDALPAAPEKPPAPTLADVQALTADSSFAPFVARDVAPEVRNAAMKKLFADPHYNVMDGLDIYIDDYSVPSPMPAAMLRQMASAKFLKLFDDDETPQAPARTEPLTAATSQTAAATDAALEPIPASVQESAQNSTQDQDPNHDHTDLRLQPDHAARPARLERELERALDPAFEPVPPPSR